MSFAFPHLPTLIAIYAFVHECMAQATGLCGSRDWLLLRKGIAQRMSQPPLRVVMVKPSSLYFRKDYKMEKVNPITSNNYSVIEDFVKAINEKYFDATLHFRVIPSENINIYWILEDTYIYKDPKKDIVYYPIKVADLNKYNNKQELVISILTQMVLAYGSAYGIQMSSRNGTYKNKRFKKVGEKLGLIFLPDRQDHGQVPIGVKQDILDLLNEDDFTMLRTYAENKWGEVKLLKGNSIKYVCPICKSIVRTTKKSVKDICGNCYEKTGKIIYREIVS